MIIINAKLKVAAEHREAYLSLMKDLVDATQQELGNLFYHHYEDVTEPNSFVVVENYRNQQAVDAHNKSAHFKVFSDNIGKYVSEQPVIDVAEVK